MNESLETRDYQKRVDEWVRTCFGEMNAENIHERTLRFMEEAIELAQAIRCTKEEFIGLVNYVYNRPPGLPYQEVGGVMVTLAALCNALKINMGTEGETEVERIESFSVMDNIRKKQTTKPSFESTPPNDPVNHPSHYTDGKIEVIDFIDDKQLGFCLGNTVKYIARAGKKDPAKTIEDLKKARWYLNHYIQSLEKKT